MMIWIAVLLTVPILLLSVPVRVRISGRYSDRERWFRAMLLWGVGLIAAEFSFTEEQRNLDLRIAGLFHVHKNGERLTGSNNRHQGRRRKPARTQRHLTPATVRRLFDRRLLSGLLGYLKQLVRSLDLRLCLTGTYGTDDPALTGMLAALVACTANENRRLELQPDFEESGVDLTGSIECRVVPIVIIGLTLKLLLTSPVRRLWWPKLFKKNNNNLKEVIQHV